MFHFKQFSVDQSGCAMKINTDGVLLAALIETGKPKRILDIGTGTGVIALILAQRFSTAYVDGVEIDGPAANTAQNNFANSPFAARLSLHASSFETFFNSNPANKYDLIVSNPPFFVDSLKSEREDKKLARHTNRAFFENLISAVTNHLSISGHFWLILPITTAALVKELAAVCGLYVSNTICIKSYPQSVPHREILVFGRQQTKTTFAEFVIYNKPKEYSLAYQSALKDLFTIFS